MLPSRAVNYWKKAMARLLRVASLDPSLNNFGMIKGTIDLDSPNFDLIIEDMQLTETDSDKANKKVVRKNSDDLTRAIKLTRAVNAFVEDVSMVFVEVPVGSQSARAMASYGICIGVLSSIRKPLIQVTPTEVKVAVTGSKTASKEEMIAWATNAYPDAPWLTTKRNGKLVLTNKNEHLADAVAAVHAGIVSDPFIQAIAILGAD